MRPSGDHHRPPVEVRPPGATFGVITTGVWGSSPPRLGDARRTLGPKTASHDHIRNVYTSYESPNRVHCRKTEVGCILKDIIGSPFCLDIVKAHAHRPIFKGIIAKSAVESADSILESADSTTDFTIVGQL